MNKNRYALYASTALILAMAGAPAAAQTDTEIVAAARACLSIGSAELRLRCFEGIFGGDSPPAASPSAAPSTDVRVPPVASAAPPAPVAPPATAVASAPPPSTDSRSRSDRDEADPAGASVRIVEVREIRPGDARFLTEDGRLYVSTGSISRNMRYPETPFTATLESGALGSSFLRFGPEDYERVRVSERN